MKRFKQVILLLTRKCNLNCAYCYVSGQYISESITRNIIDYTIDALDNSMDNEASTLQISGGEPLLFPEYFFYAVKKTKEIRPKTVIKLQTNATLVDNSIAKFIKENNVKVSVSMDSIPEINDGIRGMSSCVIKGIEKFREYDIRINLTTVITLKNVCYLEKLAAMAVSLENIGSISFDLLRKPLNNTDCYKILMPDIDLFKEHYKKAYWILKGSRFFGADVIMNDMLISSTRVRSKKNGNPYYCWSAMGDSITVTPEGDVFSCPSLIYDKSAFMGRITNREALIRRPSRSVEDLLDCKECEAKYICRGGCPSRAYLESGSNFSISEFECSYRKYIYKNFLEKETA